MLVSVETHEAPLDGLLWYHYFYSASLYLVKYEILQLMPRPCYYFSQQKAGLPINSSYGAAYPTIYRFNTYLQMQLRLAVFL